MLALIKHPGSPTERCDIPEDGSTLQLRALQKAVGGYVEIAVRLRDAVVLCDDEGKIKADRKQTNFHRPTDRDEIIGTVVVCGTEQSIDGEVWIGLTDEQADRIARLLDRWALAGAAVGQAVEDWDPENDAEAEAIRVRLRKGRQWLLRNH